jgi:hypothetical protein
LIFDIFELHDRHTDQSILATKAKTMIFDSNVEFVDGQAFFVANHAEILIIGVKDMIYEKIIKFCYYKVKVSLNFGDHTDCLVLVNCLLFLSAK